MMQSPLTMPILKMSPAADSHKLTSFFLTRSERFFPPTNMACTLGNAAVTIALYLNSSRSAVFAQKFPIVGTALALNVATTVYTLVFMVPRNNRMRVLSKALTEEGTGASKKELRELQSGWIQGNLSELLTFERWVEKVLTLLTVRAALMLSGAIAGMYGLLTP